MIGVQGNGIDDDDRFNLTILKSSEVRLALSDVVTVLVIAAIVVAQYRLLLLCV